MARRLPDADFFLPASLREARARAHARVSARASEVLHVTHGGCLDGAGADVMVRLAHPAAEVRTLYADPAEVARLLAWVAQAGAPAQGRALLLSDVSPQVGEAAALAASLARLRAQGWARAWRDHHVKQWDPATREAVAAEVARLRVEEPECGTSLCQQDLLPGDAFARELAAVVRDIDLWLRRDPRSTTLTEARHRMGSEALVAKLVRDRVVLDGELEAAARAWREEFERDVAQAIAEARVVQGKHKVGVLYGDLPGTQACHALRAAKQTDVEVHLKPDGKFSIRSRAELPFCHGVAQRFRGGGHPNASGGHLRLQAWEWPGYWLTARCRESEALVQAAANAEVTAPAQGSRTKAA